MESAPYLIVFDFMEQPAPSILPLVGMMVVGAVGVVLAIWGAQIASRILGATMAIVVVGIAITDLLTARSVYEQTRADIVAGRVRLVEGVFGVDEGTFTVGPERFSLPRRPGTQHIYAFSPIEATRFEGMCARGQFTQSGQLAALRVRPLADDGDTC